MGGRHKPTQAHFLTARWEESKRRPDASSVAGCGGLILWWSILYFFSKGPFCISFPSPAVSLWAELYYI